MLVDLNQKSFSQDVNAYSKLCYDSVLDESAVSSSQADRLAGFYRGTQVLLRPVLAEKPELSFSVVSLLWHKLIAAPEIQPTAESSSAQQGWRQAVDALCNVVSATPAKAAAAVVLQKICG